MISLKDTGRGSPLIWQTSEFTKGRARRWVVNTIDLRQFETPNNVIKPPHLAETWSTIIRQSYSETQRWRRLISSGLPLIRQDIWKRNGTGLHLQITWSTSIDSTDIWNRFHGSMLSSAFGGSLMMIWTDILKRNVGRGRHPKNRRGLPHWSGWWNMQLRKPSCRERWLLPHWSDRINNQPSRVACQKWWSTSIDWHCIRNGTRTSAKHCFPRWFTIGSDRHRNAWESVQRPLTPCIYLIGSIVFETTKFTSRQSATVYLIIRTDIWNCCWCQRLRKYAVYSQHWSCRHLKVWKEKLATSKESVFTP